MTHSRALAVPAALALLAGTGRSFGQSVGPMPAPAVGPSADVFPLDPGPRDAPASATDPMLGDPFLSRYEGISFRPPAGGAKVRQINSGEVVRFGYPDKGWVVRLQAVVNSGKLPLTIGKQAAAGDPQGLLELTAGQLTDRGAEAAAILRKDVVAIGPRDVGLIEARDSAGIQRKFVQVALVPDGKARYFSVQMVSPADDAKAGPKPAGGGEAGARRAFQASLASIQLLDRSELFREQRLRFYNTQQLWVQLGGEGATLAEHKRLAAVVAEGPVRYLRVVRGGKDVGYVQLNVRAEQHHGRDGVAVVARSHVEQLVDAAPAAAATPAPAAAGGSVVDLRQPVAAAAPTAEQIERDARFFVTFDRAHEDWSVLTRLDGRVGLDDTELGNSDVEVRRVFNAPAAGKGLLGSGADAKQPPVLERQTQMLRVDTFRGRLRTGQTFQEQLDPRYLSQAMSQLLPQLLPVDGPHKYLFAYYVSEQRHLLARYVDVGVEQVVTLDGRQVRAVPITDRIGIDGADTVHYVSRDDNAWLGSVSDDGRLLVLPTDAETLSKTWPKFAELPEPPPPAEVDEPARRAARTPVTPGPVRGR